MSLWKYKYFLDVVELKEFYKGRSKKLCNTDGSKSADRLFGKNGGRDSAGERQW